MQGMFKAEDILNFQIHSHHPQWWAWILNTSCIICTKFYIVALLIINSSYFSQWHEEKQNTSFLGGWGQWATTSGELLLCSKAPGFRPLVLPITVVLRRRWIRCTVGTIL